jgi:phosphatidylinositol alpha-1,6-mannosyltransferase
MRTHLLLSYDFPPIGGGIARWMAELAKRYPAGSLVVSTGSHPEASDVDATFPNRVDRLPVPVRRLRNVQGLLLWAQRTAVLARSTNAGFIWCGNIKPAAYPAKWTRERLGTPFGILLHGGDLLILQHQIHQSAMKRRTAKGLLGSASVLVANSEWTRERCLAVLHELELDSDPARVLVVPLGADQEFFRPGLDTREVRERYSLADGRWLLSVARLTRHKGIDTVLAALAQLRSVYSDLRYAVVGEGEDRPALEAEAQALGLGDRVRFLSGVPDRDLPALYNCADVYVGVSRLLSQRVEGFGISLCEASACGVPVVAGRSGGMPEAVHDGETGILVDAESADNVATALRRLLDDPALRARFGSAGRTAVERHYNWDRVTADLVRIARSQTSVGAREAAS